MNTRRKKTLMNTFTALIYQIINLIIGMFLPKIIINVYGSEINGLSSNINQYLNILNLLQAGIIAASAYEMYKPITNKNYKLIGSIFYSAKSYFNKCSYVLLILSVTIIPLMLYGKSSTLTFYETLISVTILGLNSFVIFKYYCKFDLIFSAHQDKYILFFSMYIEKFIYYPLLFLGLHFRLNYNFMYISLLIATICKIGFLQIKFKKRFENNIKPYKNIVNYKVKNQFHVLGNQIIFRIMDTFPIIIVTGLYNLSYASIYSIYIMVIAIFKMIFDTIQNSAAPSFGDLYASGNKDRYLEVFDTFQFLYFILINVVVICLSGLFLPFISIYIGNISDINYVCSTLAFFITLQFITYSYYFQFNMVINSTGRYKLILRSNIAGAIFCVLIMIVAATINFEYIYFGVFLYYFICSIFNYIVIKRNTIKITLKYLVRPIISICVYIISVLLFTNFFFNYIGTSIARWLISGGVLFCIAICVSIFVAFLVDRQKVSLYIKVIKEKIL